MRPRKSSPSRPFRSIAALAAALALAVPILGLPTAGGAAATPAHSSASARVDIHEFAFHPQTLTVARGTKVVFANGDPTAHTATANGGAFATGHIRPGHAVAVKFAQRGTFAYHCSIHHFMHGKVVVR